jgi:hypothetical protein
MNTRTGPAERKLETSARPTLVRGLLLVVGLFLVYKIGRQVANGRTDEAFHNANRVWHLERDIHLPDEGAVQGVLLHSETLIHLANTYYATVHFPATVLFLGWLYWRRPRHYLWSRRALAALTGAALAFHLLLPLAPPRMLVATGLIDTGRVFGPTVYGAKPAADSMENQFAAMPSLHFGWALMVAVGLIVATRSRWRWLWLLHPLVTLFVVIGTANHYWLDTIVAGGLLAVALAVIRVPRAASKRRGSLVVRTSVPGRTAPVSAVPGAAAPAVAASADPSPGRAAPGRAAPGRAAPGRAAPGRAAPEPAASESSAPLVAPFVIPGGRR